MDAIKKSKKDRIYIIFGRIVSPKGGRKGGERKNGASDIQKAIKGTEAVI